MSSISMYSKTASLPSSQANSALHSSHNKQQTSLAITSSANLLAKGTASVFSSFLVSQKVPAQLMNFEPVPQPHFRPPPTIKNLAPTLYDDPAFSADPQSNPFCVTGHDSAWGSKSTLSLGHPTLNFLRRSQLPRTSPDAGQVESDSDDSLLLIQPPNSPDIPSLTCAQSSSPFFNPSQGCELSLRPPMTSGTTSQNSHASTRTLQKRLSVRTAVTDKDTKKRGGFLNLFKSPVEKSEPAPVIPPRDPRRKSNSPTNQGDTLSARPAASRHITAPEIHHGTERPLLPARPVSTPAGNSIVPGTKIKAADGRSRAHDLDKIDELDETNPLGLHIHHDGPYEAAKSKVKPPTVPHNSLAQFPPYTFVDNGITHYYTPHQPITSSIKLSPGQILPRSYQAHHLAPPPVRNQPHTFDAPLLDSHSSEDVLKPRQQQSRHKQTSSAAPINSSRPLVANVSPPRPQEDQKTQAEDPSINIGMSMMYPDTSVDSISIPPKLKHGEPLHEIEEVEEEEFNPYLLDQSNHPPVKESVAIRVQDASLEKGSKALEDDHNFEDEFRRRQAAGSPVPLHDHTSRLVVANPSDSPLSTTSPSDTLRRRPSNMSNVYIRAPSPKLIESPPPIAIPPHQDARADYSPPSYMEQPQQNISSHYPDVIRYENIRHNRHPPQQNVSSHYSDTIQYEDIRPNQQPSQQIPSGFLLPYISDRPTRPEAVRRQSEVIQYEDIRHTVPLPTRSTTPPPRSKPTSLSPDEQYRIYRRELERERQRDARSTIQSISTTSSGQKPSHPHHVPKRLVMPAPLQQSTAIFTEQVPQYRQSVAFPNQTQQRRNSIAYPEQMKERHNSHYQFSHGPYITRTPSPPGLVSPTPGKHPIAQEIPMSSAARKLRKRTSVFDSLKGHDAPEIAAVSFPIDAQYMEPPSGDARSNFSKPGRHPKRLLSKRHVDF